MKKLLLYLNIAAVFFSLGYFLRNLNIKDYLKDYSTQPIIEKEKEKPLERYAIENLAKTDIKAGIFTIEESLKETNEFESYLFSYEFNPSLDGKSFKKITGQINLPSDLKISESETEIYPVVLMFRGYINQEIYKTGDGTRNASEYFAKEGFITIAPDFLGYGGSDKETENIFETRFQTYVTAISLLKYLETNPESKLPALRSHGLVGEIGNWVTGNLFLWGHSNGGQIALTVLEITGAYYPTTLWAPVSKPFPYSVLYYTDESEDRGKLIRNELAIFEKDYDVEKYSLTNYLDKINAPIQIHQGASDNAVPKSWSDTLSNLLKQKDKDVKYYTYPETDHNMRPNWNTVVELDLELFRKYLRS